MSCPYAEYLVMVDGRCVSPVCPARDDCPNGDERPCRPTPPAFYVALIGPLTDGPVGYLGNVRRFCDAAAALMLAGFCPVNPAADLLECYADPALTVAIVQERTRQMIRLVALAPPGRRAALCLGTRNAVGRLSFGTVEELAACGELGIPVCTTLDELLAMRGTEP